MRPGDSDATGPGDSGATPVTWADMLRAFRRRRGWTQDQLADYIGVTRWTIMRWEKGQVSDKPRVIADAALAMGVDPIAAFRGLDWLPPVEDQHAEDDELLAMIRDPATPRDDKDLAREMLRLRTEQRRASEAGGEAQTG